MNSYEIIQALKELSLKKNIRWDMHDCCLCGSPVGYIFINGSAYFDSMCDCSTFDHEPEYRGWDEVQETIERNINSNMVKNLVEIIRKEQKENDIRASESSV